jgi:hydrogenase nickel incorporation protein HypB
MMCVTCGCGDGAETSILDLQTGKQMTMERHAAHEHTHADGTTHSHAPTDTTGHHDPAQADEHVHADGTWHSLPHGTVALDARILAKNDALADCNRAWFQGREILALNLVSSPGSGKTSLLERTIHDLKGEMSICVVEGDQATANDGERIRAAGAPAVQVNTGTGCHLEADMVAQGLLALRPQAGSIVMIENVGNLVCPALFDLGERAKVVILSVTEGEDKPLKYPHMFRAAEVMILNKTDLLPYVDFDVARAMTNARAVNPDIVVFQLLARCGDGLEAWYDWLRRELAAARIVAFTSSD